MYSSEEILPPSKGKKRLKLDRQNSGRWKGVVVRADVLILHAIIYEYLANKLITKVG
jgi:hypothetical protein